MKFFSILILIGLFASRLSAGELSLYYLYNAMLEYEGTGYRQFDQGWELKVKPNSDAKAVRWRNSLSKDLTLQVFYVGNRPFFGQEDGNAASAIIRQTGETKMAIQSLMADLRCPWENSSIGVLAGLQGARTSFERKDIVFNQVPEPNKAREIISALGLYLGFYGGHPAKEERTFYWDWDATIGHFFWTRNTMKTEGGSINRNGLSYTFRLEGGYRLGRWRMGAGYFRQLLEIMVPGGKTLPSGAAVSFPVNKMDFFSPFVILSYGY